MAIELGRLCVLKVDVDGSPTELACIKDVKVTESAETADATARSNAGWKGKRQGLKEWSAQFEAVRDIDDPVLAALRKAYGLGTILTAEFYNASDLALQKSGECFVSDFSSSEPLSGVVTISVTLEGTGALTYVTTNWV